jgi:serine protease
VDAPAAWDITTGSSNVRIAVLDTGITDHADLNGRWTGGYDMITDPATANDGGGRDSNPHDPGDWITANECYSGSPARNSSWHGTHVAGTIAAATNNGAGVAGLNWVSQVIPVRVLGKCGGSTSDIADAIRWAAGLSVSGVPDNTHPAQVINMSLGGGGSCSTSMQNAINDAYNAKTTVVVSAGNSNQDAGNFTPANCNNVITVAATDRNGNRASYSNFGSVVEIAAPGGDQSTGHSDGVLSTLNSGTTTPAGDIYEYYQGTSMAAPHVAGIVSLIYSVKPSITPAEVLSILQNTVTLFPGGSTCNTSNCGSGIANAGAAVALANSGVTAPTLNPISNSDGDGNYTVSWNAVTVQAAASTAHDEIHPSAVNTYTIYLPIILRQSTTYTLQEDDNSGFTSPTTVYSGAGTSWNATGKAPGTYYYRVRVTTSQGTSGWSNIQSVTVGSGTGPTPGFWEGSHEEFYVTPNGANVDNFALYIYVNGCGNYKITSGSVNPIANNSFADTDGAFIYSGTFSSSTAASGDEELIDFNIDGCGLVSGGPWNWTASWKDNSQPTFFQATRVLPDTVDHSPGGQAGYSVIKLSP